MIGKQQANGKESHPECLHAVESYEKVENVNTQKNYETTSEK